MKEAWVLKPLGEVCTLQRGFDLPMQDRKPGAYPIISSSGLIDTHDEGRVTGPGVVTGRSGSLGNVFYVKDDFWPLNTTLYVRDFHKNDPRFVYYLLTAFDLSRFGGGAGVPTLNRNDVHREMVRIPTCKDEQRRVVALLDAAFEAIAKVKDNVEKNLQSVRKLFDSHHQAVFLRSREGAKVQRLGDIAEFRNGINYTKQSKGSPVQIIGVKNFQDHFWAPTDDLDTVTLDGDLREADKVVEGDILSVRSNGNPELIGRCILVGKVQGPVTHSGFTIRIRLRCQDALPEYVCHFLKSREIRRTLVNGGNGLSISSLNQGMLSELVISLPAVDIQKRIVAEIETVSTATRQLAELARMKLLALDELKRSLLRDALNGKLTSARVAQEMDTVA